MRAILLIIAVTFGTVGCGGSDEPPPPERKPPSWDDQSEREWLYRSQFKGHMRHLWLDSNRVASAARGDAEPTWHEVWSGAADIARRAKLLGGFWRELDERAETMIECMDDGDRLGASIEFKALGAACDGCHLASWSPAYLHVTNGVVEGWLRNQTTPHGVEEVDQDPPPAIPNRVNMQQLWAAYYDIELRLERWEVAEIRKSLARMQPEFKTHAQHWKGVEENAATLVELAKKNKREGLQQAYEQMTAHCTACHDEQAGPPREILTPMSWK